MPKTRQQRLQEAEAGALPSPPRSLLDQPRPKRARTNNSTPVTASSQQPASEQAGSVQTTTSARATTSKRNGKGTTQRSARSKARAKPAAAAQADSSDEAPEASDNSTDQNRTARSYLTPEEEEHIRRVIDKVHGETQLSPSDSDATPRVYAGSPYAGSPYTGSPTARLAESPSGQMQTPRSGFNAAHPVHGSPSTLHSVDSTIGEMQNPVPSIYSTPPTYTAPYFTTPPQAERTVDEMQTPTFSLSPFATQAEIAAFQAANPPPAERTIAEIQRPRFGPNYAIATSPGLSTIEEVPTPPSSSNTARPVHSATSSPHYPDSLFRDPDKLRAFFPSTPSAAELSFGDMQTPTPMVNPAHPVHSAASSPRMEERTVGEVETPRAGYNATHPVYGADSTSPRTPNSADKWHSSETSELFRQIIAARLSASMNTQTPNTTQGSPSAQGVPRPIPIPTPPSVSAQPVPPGSAGTPSRPIMPNLLGVPSLRNEHYSVIRILVDSLPATDGSELVSRQDSSIAFAIPTVQVPRFLAQGSARDATLKTSLSEHPVVQSLMEEYSLTDDVGTDPISTNNRGGIQLKRKRADDEPAYPDIMNDDEAARKMGKKMKDAFYKMARESRRTILEDSLRHAKTADVGMFEDRAQQTRGVYEESENPYKYDEVPNADEAPLQENVEPLHDQIQQDESHENQVQEEQISETPRSRGWGLSSLIPSVSRFIPFTSRRTPHAHTPELSENVAMNAHTPEPNENVVMNEPSNNENVEGRQPVTAHSTENTIMNEPSQTPDSGHRQSANVRGAQTAPRQRTTTKGSHHNRQGHATSALAERHHKEQPQRLLFTKKEKEQRDRLKEEKRQLSIEITHLMEEKVRMAQEKEDWEKEKAQATASQVPGTKRKRMPSPEVYPLPAMGYGLVPEIFEYNEDYSDVESSQDEETPTKPRPFKKARLSTEAAEESVASSYGGELFVAGPESSKTGANQNLFGTSVLKSPVSVLAGTVTPAGATKNRFCVPSPSTDDEFDEEYEPPEDITDATYNDPSSSAQAAAAISPSKSSQVPQAPTSILKKSMAPPPTPTPSHATLPAPLAYVDPVEKAREKALKHQPKHGSRLRQASRLSASPMASEAARQTSRLSSSPMVLPDIQISPRNPAKPATKPANNDVEPTTIRHQKAPWDGKGFAYDNYSKDVDFEVWQDLECNFDEVGDDILRGSGQDEFEEGFAAYRQSQFSSKKVKKARAPVLNAPVAAVSMSYQQANIDPDVRKHIDASITPEDQANGIDTFGQSYDFWKTKELAMEKKGAEMSSITA